MGSATVSEFLVYPDLYRGPSASLSFISEPVRRIETLLLSLQTHSLSQTQDVSSETMSFAF